MSSEDRGADEERNLFVAFRRLADEQVTSLVQGLRELPWSRLGIQDTWDKKMQERDARQEESTQSQRPYQPGTRSDEDEAGITSARAPSTFHRHARWSHHTGSDQPCHYRTSVFAGRTLPISYLLQSPYSPLHLEHNEIAQEADIPWREALEDLLDSSAGRPLTTHRPLQRFERPEPYDEWMSGLVKKGLVSNDNDIARIPFGILEPFRAGMSSLMEFLENDDNPDTELDLYERFLGIPNPHGYGEDPSQCAPVSSSRDGQTSRILSQMTTTERHTAADGTVTTKTVLKRRFADGREESEESTSTTLAPHPSKEVPKPFASIREIFEDDSRSTSEAQQHATETSGKKKDSSWFWST